MKNNPNNQFATKKDLHEVRGEIRKDILGFKEEIKDYVGVLHEQFSDQVKVVAEQQVDINRNIAGIKKHVGRMDQRLDKLEIKTDMLMETVADIKMDTTMIREELENKADKTEVKKLEHRVTALGSRA